MTKVGVVALSFSLREIEPNPCNVRLAQESERICEDLTRKGFTPKLVAQWEIGLALTRDAEIVGVADDGSYLGTKEVLSRAVRFFDEENCDSVVVVANPFLHQQYACLLARRLGMRVVWRRVRWVGFDSQSTQWWCRSWYQFLYQTVRLVLGFKHGHDGRQESSS